MDILLSPLASFSFNPENLAFMAAIGGAIAGVVVKGLDCLITYCKTKHADRHTEVDAFHQLNEDSASFRQELWNEVHYLRQELKTLEEKLDLGQRERDVISREIVQLKIQNAALREELSKMREKNAALMLENQKLSARIKELEQKSCGGIPRNGSSDSED